MAMEKRIELERRGRSPAEIKKLNLNTCQSTQITGLTDEYCNLESLSLISVGLTTLEGFPKLPNLKKLELCDNLISGDLHWLHGSPKLVYLYLSGNKIKDIESLMPLGQLKNLKSLDLFGCEVRIIENYRDEVFGFISSLKFLDGYDRNNKVADDSEAKIDGDDCLLSTESETENASTNSSGEEEDESFDSEASTANGGSSHGAITTAIPAGSFSFGGTTQTASFTAIARNTSGTTTKFNPVIGIDDMIQGGVYTTMGTKLQAITGMKEYANKSFEELRVEDYAANRKGATVSAPATRHTDLVTRLPAVLTPGFAFSNTTNSKPPVGSTGKTDIAILQKHFKDLLLSEDDHDVTIKIKNREYKAHKCILRARSPVFSAMFKHQMQENIDNSICIEDCDAEDFSKFLQYIYTGEVENLSPSSALNLYYAADKYQISRLKETCVNFLKFTLSTASICGVIKLATKHNEIELLQCAVSFFSEHLEKILITVDWQRFLIEHPFQANELYIKAVKTSYKKKS